MSAGLLFITHNDIGRVLLQSAVEILGHCPMACQTLAVSTEADRESLVKQARDMLGELDQGDGVIILTDIYGGSPCNVAVKLGNDRVRVISGLNLPMLLRIFNYRDAELDDLVEKALVGATRGVMQCV